jgi:hypothetical protein
MLAHLQRRSVWNWSGSTQRRKGGERRSLWVTGRWPRQDLRIRSRGSRECMVSVLWLDASMQSDLTCRVHVRSSLLYVDVVAWGAAVTHAGREGPDSGAASIHDWPDTSNHKTEARGGLWKWPGAGSVSSSVHVVTSSLVHGGARPDTRT